jgi:acyl homoserine lactone synthase
MQILAIRQTDNTRSALLAQMHRLRSRVFKDRLGWQVGIGDLEIDEFDEFGPTYLLAINQTGDVVGCVRLLPAMGPTMLATKFPELLKAGELSAHPKMVETSRFCVDTSCAHKRVETAHLHHATLCLLAGIVEWCLKHGFTEVVTATDLRIERILTRAKWPLDRLGKPCMINETRSIAGRLIADIHTFERLRPDNYSSLLSAAIQAP